MTKYSPLTDHLITPAIPFTSFTESLKILPTIPKYLGTLTGYGIYNFTNSKNIWTPLMSCEITCIIPIWMPQLSTKVFKNSFGHCNWLLNKWKYLDMLSLEDIWTNWSLNYWKNLDTWTYNWISKRHAINYCITENIATYSTITNYGIDIYHPSNKTIWTS